MNVIVIVCDTLRRDHCAAYTGGRPLNECWSAEAPPWAVPTPNMDRLAARGTVFDNCWSGSYPTMPARRDIHTGRLEFLERGWGPLEDDDLDLARRISGPNPTRSVQKMVEDGWSVSSFIADNQNFWCQGSGNYHMGFTGFEFIRGNQEDPWHTDPAPFFVPESERASKLERYFRNIARYRRGEEDETCAQVFRHAARWLERNHTYKDFFLYVDSFAPHEPWDPPEGLLQRFDPKGYAVEGWKSHPPYVPWRGQMNEEQFNSFRARYAAKVALVDRWLGRLIDAIDMLDLWKNTLVIFTTDHGTFNGDHGRIGKNQTHLHDALGRIPFLVCHPRFGHGERRAQLAQLVDVYTTTLAAVGKPIPPDRHGVNLLPVLEEPSAATTRDYALLGVFGNTVTFTDGEWILHQAPKTKENQPLYWHGMGLARFSRAELGPVVAGRRTAKVNSFSTPTWLSDKRSDPNELTNLAQSQPKKLREMQAALRETLLKINAPKEQLERLGI
ncbi:MAG: sulfatase [Candidatus Sumerlaeota bacterium]|nr:sulfatase [Candidatus Sumerlaeota bacterium]